VATKGTPADPLIFLNFTLSKAHNPAEIARRHAYQATFFQP
jgi:hypothetical protein